MPPPPPPPRRDAAADSKPRDDLTDEDDSPSKPDNKAQELKVQQVRVEPAARPEASPAAPVPDEEKEPCCACCTCRCTCKYLFKPIGYFFLGILILVGMILALVFIILHFVMRVIHLLFYAMSLSRNVLDSHIDAQALVDGHAEAVKKDRAAWEANLRKRQAEREARNTKERITGSSPKKSSRPAESSSSDSEWEEPGLRLCSVQCATGSTCFGIGSLFGAIAAIFMALAFTSGIAAIGIFTAVVPSCSLRGAAYLAAFRSTYDPRYRKSDSPPEPSS